MTMDGRSLLDGDETPTRENPNVFDDEFEVEDFDGVADGFRPSNDHGREGGGGRQDEEGMMPVRSISAHYAPGVTTAMAPSRDSTRKSRSHENPFASPEDADTEPPLQRTPSGNFAPFAHRSISSASSHQFARTGSSRFGAGGPSHPYEMYPQGTMARTPSTATTSTVRPQRRSSARAGPQHPYALYTQGVGEDLDDEHSAAQSQVPIGFTGLGQSYQRRRGPDGEEQDIIGDYGHTEQLPPYTRYPEDGPEKVPLLTVPEPPTASHSRAPVLGTDPGMSLMHQQLQPTAQSMTDESDLARQQSNLSRRSGLIDGDSPTDSLIKKHWNEKTWREKRKTRVCWGIIPFWVILLALGVLIFIAAVLGGVIGGFVQGQHSQENKASRSSSMYDASLIATPTATSPPTGTFALSLSFPEETQAGCLSDTSQRPAWDCDMASEPDIAINIYTPIGQNQSGAYLYTTIDDDDGVLSYGTQGNAMSTTFSPFLLVKDNDDPEAGEAFYFQTQYNKVVVVPGDAIQGPGKSKRDFNVPSDFFVRKQVATPGDQPWFCFWNNTFLEGFIYVNQPAVLPTTTTTSSLATSTTTHPWPDYMSITAAPSETITKTFTMPTTTCTYTGPASSVVPWLNTNYPDWNSSYPDGRPGYHKRDDDDYSSQMQVYPYQIKLEERRLPGSPTPYCVKYQVLDNGECNWIPDEHGQQIVVSLQEQDPEVGAYQKHGSRRLSKRRSPVPGSCHCQWMSGQ